MYDLIVILVLLLVGYSFGSIRERRHFSSIQRREKQLKDIMLFDTRHLPEVIEMTGGELVSGHVVISVDYFKRFVAGLRLLFGGRLTSYESLLDRGRREAVLRMKEQAQGKGAEQIFNVKFETASISKGESSSLGSIEVYVYGSCVKPA